MKLHDQSTIINRPLQLVLVFFMISSAYIAESEQLSVDHQVESSNELENIESEEISMDEFDTLLAKHENDLCATNSMYFHLNATFFMHNGAPTTPPPELLY